MKAGWTCLWVGTRIREVHDGLTQVDKISDSLPVLETVSWHLREAMEFYHGIGMRLPLEQSLAGA